MGKAIFIIVALFLSLPLLAQEPAPENAPDFRDIVILPYMTTSENKDAIKWAWDETAELFSVKGYRVVPLDKMMAAMAKAEISATGFYQVIDSDVTAGEGVKWYLQDHPEAVTEICKLLHVSRVITAFVSEPKVKDRPWYSRGLINNKKVQIEVTAAAWGYRTGRCLWQASSKSAKRNYYFSFFSPLKSKMIPEAVKRSIYEVFDTFLQQERLAYGNAGIELTVANVTATKSMGRVNLTWSTVDDKRITGYAIYRALNNEAFSAYPIATTMDLKFTDKVTDRKLVSSYRYAVSVLSDECGEGALSPGTKAL